MFFVLQKIGGDAAFYTGGRGQSADLQDARLFRLKLPSGKPDVEMLLRDGWERAELPEGDWAPRSVELKLSLDRPRRK